MRWVKVTESASAATVQAPPQAVEKEEEPSLLKRVAESVEVVCHTWHQGSVVTLLHDVLREGHATARGIWSSDLRSECSRAKGVIAPYMMAHTMAESWGIAAGRCGLGKSGWLR